LEEQAADLKKKSVTKVTDISLKKYFSKRYFRNNKIQFSQNKNG